MPFGGKFRIIDFPLSNCVNSSIRRTGVLTQYKAHSLIRHLQGGWGFLHKELGEFVEILPAPQRVHELWYRGTADALYQNIDILRTYKPSYVLVLAGDHVYKMDYGPMLAFHRSGAHDDIRYSRGHASKAPARISSPGSSASHSSSRFVSPRS